MSISWNVLRSVNYITMCLVRTSNRNTLNVRFCPILRLISYSQPHFKEQYEMTFLRTHGEPIKAKFKEGDTILDVVVNNSVDLDGYVSQMDFERLPENKEQHIVAGACEGTLTCSTCHVIFKKEDYDRLPEKPSDEELDMLDLAYELSDTSRLGCQITLSKDHDGLEVQVPSTINDARES